ncbi:maleylpyruvate isomerase family mycothiol-dependent enzyme [Nocardia sp. NPDC049190]|uniref:maleylpyruvate isomerase family mycothiol-dependent enzyme n=1 Tax=Nocardia sp. NPDC049190 TaxID=3155650 RepID=UPI0033F3D48C
MHPRALAQTRRWAALGTDLFIRAVSDDEDWLRAVSGLPDWSRRQLLAHVAANADALGNLVHWAATGEPTPMYATPHTRAADIARGSKLPAPDLLAWLSSSADALEHAMNALDGSQWTTSVVTAQGRTVPATEIPWLRAREVCVHGVDLAHGITFADLPADFLAALCDDVLAKLATTPRPALVLEATDSGDRWVLPGDESPITLVGSLPQITAYLTGRPYHLISDDAVPPPVLGPWL